MHDILREKTFFPSLSQTKMIHCIKSCQKLFSQCNIYRVRPIVHRKLYSQSTFC
jgi:hypothetical protein